MRRVYIAGCGGMLGQAFHEELRGGVDIRGIDIDASVEWPEHLDFRNLDAYREDVRQFARLGARVTGA